MRSTAAAIAAILISAVPTTAHVETAEVLKAYAEIARAVYSDSLDGAKALRRAVSDMLAKPNAETLAVARQAWIDARVPYLQSEAFRFTNPIIDAWEGKVNAWPLDEGLIDYVATSGQDTDNPLFSANVIANRVLKIDETVVDASRIHPDLLRETLHEASGLRANVATGWHAIEFLLWGQDLNGTGPGARQVRRTTGWRSR